MVKSVGPVHGVLFIIFVILALEMGIKQKWSILKTSLVLLSSFIPFGTFYVDHKILKPLQQRAGK